jgi:repressor LexA
MLKGYILKKPNKPRSISVKNEIESKSVTLPVLGVISAGEGISVFEETNPELIEVPSTMVNTDVAHYCLRVKGNSMIEDGILDGDYIVVRQQKTADNGDAVVAIINDDDEEKANLKRFYLRGKIVELRPRNKQLKSKYYPVRKIEIRGKFCGLIRQS